MRIIVIDSNPAMKKELEGLVSSWPWIEISAQFDRPADAMDWLKSRVASICLWEVNLVTTEWLVKIRSLPHPPAILFLSDEKERKVPAFQWKGFGYLTKPVSAAILHHATTHVQASLFSLHAEEEINHVWIRAEGKMVKLFLKDILYIESLKDYVSIHTLEGRDWVIKQRISEVEHKLPYPQFLRIHRSYLVAFHHVNAYSPTHVEVGEVQLPVGRRFKQGIGWFIESGIHL